MYHLHAQILRRSDGRSATAAAAYRSASKITDQRTGMVWDFSRKRFTTPLALVLPEGTPIELADRATLWNDVEVHAKRRDAQVAREFEVALPHDLTRDGETALVLRFARWLVSTYSIAVDACIHRVPGNRHAHLLTTTSTLGPDGIGGKVRALDLIAAKKENPTVGSPIEAIREQWESMTNEALAAAGSVRRVDRRSLAEQGIDRTPQQHQGPTATAIARRGGTPDRTRTLAQKPREDKHETQPRQRTRRRSEPEHAPQHHRTHRR